MAVLFPDTMLKILPYNRVVTDLLGREPQAVLADLKARFRLLGEADAIPDGQGSFRVGIVGSGGVCWSDLRLPPTAGGGVIASLPATRLQEQVLAPMLGIEDPRSDKRIDFVGGIRGTGELERRLLSGNAKVAFSLYPTTMEELFAVADAGEIMPPKSTWFEPKLRSGLFLHRIA